MMYSHEGNSLARSRLWLRKDVLVPERESLLETLRSTSAVLVRLRKSITLSGHLDVMMEIDTLLAVAQTEINRSIAMARIRSGVSKT